MVEIQMIQFPGPTGLITTYSLLALERRCKIAVLFNYLPHRTHRDPEATTLEHVAYLTRTVPGMLAPHGENLSIPLRLGIFFIGLRRLEVSRPIATTFRCPAPFINAGLSDPMLLRGGLDTVRFGRLKNFLLHASRVPLAPSRVSLLRPRFLPAVHICFRHRQPPL